MPTPPTDLAAIGDLERNPERSLQFEFVRATENAALTCLPWLGRNAKETADDAASRAITEEELLRALTSEAQRRAEPQPEPEADYEE